MIPQNEAMIQHQKDVPQEEVQHSTTTTTATTSSSTTTAAATTADAQRLVRTVMEDNSGRSGTSLIDIRHLVDTCPEALAVCSTKESGDTPMDALWRRCFDELDSDNDDAQLMAYCISKYTSDTLLVHSARLGMVLGPTVTRALASSSTKIKTLHLSNLQLSREGLLELLDQLASNTCLETLLFEWTSNITAKACLALQLMLQQNSTLKHLTIRTRLMSVGEASHLRNALESSFGRNNNKTLLHFDMPLIAQYRLYLSMSLDLYHSTETTDPVAWRHKVGRTTLDMHLALNRADSLLLDPEMASKGAFCNILSQATSSWSAQYVLLQRAPHLWSRDE